MTSIVMTQDGGPKTPKHSCFDTSLTSHPCLKGLILEGQFARPDKSVVRLCLLEGCIVMVALSEPNTQQTCSQWHFSQKSAFSSSSSCSMNPSQPYLITLRQAGTHREDVFQSPSYSMGNIWSDVLKAHINQQGFEDHYDLVKPIGKGHTATVYLATRKGDQKKVAVKVFDRRSNNLKIQEAFLGQIQMLKSLQHSKLLRIYDSFVQPQFIYLVTEYFPSGTLYDEVTAKSGYNKKEQSAVVRDLMSVVEYLRVRRIAHRDIKLENVFVRVEGDQKQYVLGDFGLAAAIDQRSRVFTRCGTPGYTAPEILALEAGKSMSLSTRIDIFSLGVVFHIIFTNQTVFQCGQDVSKVTASNKKCYIKWKNPCYKSLSKGQLQLLQCMLTQNPKNRLNSKQLLGLAYFRNSNIPQKLSPEDQTRRSSSDSQSGSASDSETSSKKQGWSIFGLFRRDKESPKSSQSVHKTSCQETSLACINTQRSDDDPSSLDSQNDLPMFTPFYC